MKTSKEYFNFFSEELSRLDDEQLISRFNQSVNVKAFGIPRQGYLWAIRNQLEKRNIDFSEIGNSDSISYKNIVILKNKKLYLSSELKNSNEKL
jgi:hypothetical protein